MEFFQGLNVTIVVINISYGKLQIAVTENKVCKLKFKSPKNYGHQKLRTLLSNEGLTNPTEEVT